MPQQYYYSRDEIRAKKRNRFGYSYTDFDEYGNETSLVGFLKSPPACGPHVPNKNEARLLRRLMAETGLTEAQLREHKKYRIALSTAQKSRGVKTPDQRLVRKVLKQVTRELGLAKEHPFTKDAFKHAWDLRKTRRATLLNSGEAWKLLGIEC